MEFWPVDEDNPGGCENYGWGATLPALILRNIIGFREAGGRDVFLLAPALPRTACSPGHSYGGRATLRFRHARFEVTCTVMQDDRLDIELTCLLGSSGTHRDRG